jgi:hypothetical protein
MGGRCTKKVLMHKTAKEEGKPPMTMTNEKILVWKSQKRQSGGDTIQQWQVFCKRNDNLLPLTKSYQYVRKSSPLNLEFFCVGSKPSSGFFTTLCYRETECTDQKSMQASICTLLEVFTR